MQRYRHHDRQSRDDVAYADPGGNVSYPTSTDEELLNFIDGLLMDDEYSLDNVPPVNFYNVHDADNPSNAINYVDLHSVLDGQDIDVIFDDQDSGVVLDHDADSVEDWLARLPTPPPGAIINIDWSSMFNYDDRGEQDDTFDYDSDSLLTSVLDDHPSSSGHSGHMPTSSSSSSARAASVVTPSSTGYVSPTATNTQSNRSKQDRNHQSTKIGQKFRARIKKKNIIFHLGTFDTKEEAQRAEDKYRSILTDEFVSSEGWQVRLREMIQNDMNERKQHSSPGAAASGVIRGHYEKRNGVYQRRTTGKFVATISKHNTKFYLGVFDTMEEAQRIVDKYRSILTDEFVSSGGWQVRLREMIQNDMNERTKHSSPGAAASGATPSSSSSSSTRKRTSSSSAAPAANAIRGRFDT